MKNWKRTTRTSLYTFTAKEIIWRFSSYELKVKKNCLVSFPKILFATWLHFAIKNLSLGGRHTPRVEDTHQVGGLRSKLRLQLQPLTNYNPRQSLSKAPCGKDPMACSGINTLSPFFSFFVFSERLRRYTKNLCEKSWQQMIIKWQISTSKLLCLLFK